MAAPGLATAVEDDAGPVLVTLEYRVAAEMREAFFAAVRRLGRQRKRDGAYAWSLYEDAAHPERVLETSLVDSWLEHLRQHQRVTKADRLVEDTCVNWRVKSHASRTTSPHNPGHGSDQGD